MVAGAGARLTAGAALRRWCLDELPSPENHASDTDADKDRLIKRGLLAFAYGHLDLTAALFAMEPVAARIAMSLVSAQALVGEVGAWRARRRKREMRSECCSGISWVEAARPLTET